MRTTVDLPDDLFRRAKAAAALRGRKLRDLIEEGLLLVLDNTSKPLRKKQETAFDLMQEFCGVVDSGIDDLGSDPKHMAGFGCD